MIKRYIKLQSAIVLICCLCLATACIAVDKLGSYGINKDSVSVSGISSGGYMAQQFHVAHSKSVIGAGIIAGGPFFCARGNLANICSCANLNNCFSAPANISASIDSTQKEAAHNRIDNPKNMKTSRVWLFSGRKDTMIPTAVMDTVKEYYQAYLPEQNINYVINEHAAHAMISVDAKNACGYFGLPYMNNCNNYDAAGELLQWIYDGKLEKRGVAEQNHLLEFDQTEFFDTSDDSISMNEVGHIYVPDDCVKKNGKVGCRLHIAFHGCEQYQELIKDEFYAHAGYNEWAEKNRIIILYPQTTKWDVLWFMFGWGSWNRNPKGCWDWWGYSDSDYFVKKGKQIQAIKKMVDHLAK
jgi:hypothetical protein